MAGLDFSAVDSALVALMADGGAASGSGAPSSGSVTALLRALVTTTKAVNQWPTDEQGDVALFSSTDGFQARSDEAASAVLAVLTGILEQVRQQRGAAPNAGETPPRARPQVKPGSGAAITAALAGDPADPSSFDGVRDVLDALLEGIDASLDEVRGTRRCGAAAPAACAPLFTQAQGATAEAQVQTLLRRVEGGGAVPTAGAGGARPQDVFAAPFRPDNSRRPFVPRLQVKYNATHGVPTLVGSGAPPPAVQQRSAPHPYGPELAELEFPSWLFSRAEEAPFVSPFTTPFAFVDTPEALAELLAHLESPAVREVAVDLEHHSMHSHQGITCLLQLSTRSKNFVVDTLALRGHLHELNRVTTDPTVLKVMHGCRQDVLWLQRDFGVYLVGVLDTGAAAKALNFPALGLAYLLRTYAGVEAAKQHQLADWRVRALPAEMVAYTRDDTHYLLGIADRLRNALLEAPGAGNAALEGVLAASTRLCAAAYEKERLDAAAVRQLRKKTVQGRLNAAGTRVFEALAEWRDRQARLADESAHVILPRRAMAKLARTPPTTQRALLAALRPVPPTVRARAAEVVALCTAAVAGTYTVPWDDAVLPPPGWAQDGALFDGTWTAWAASVRVVPRAGLERAAAKVLEGGGLPVLARPGRALQSAPEPGDSGLEEGSAPTPVRRAAAVPGADEDSDGDVEPAPAAAPAVELPAALGTLGVAPEPLLGFLHGHMVGILAGTTVTAPLGGTPPSPATPPAPGFVPATAALAAAAPVWAAAAAAVAPHGAVTAPQVAVHVTAPDGSTRAATASAVRAAMAGQYLHQLLPEAAPQLQAGHAAPAPPAAAAGAGVGEEEDIPAPPTLPASLADVYDLSLRSRKRAKGKGKSSGAAGSQPPQEAAGDALPPAKRQAVLADALAEDAGQPGEGAFLAALGWGKGVSGVARVPGASVPAPAIAQGSKAAARSMLAGKGAGKGGAHTVAGIAEAGRRAGGKGAAATSVADIARRGGRGGRKGRKGKSRKGGGSSSSNSGGGGGGGGGGGAMSALLRG